MRPLQELVEYSSSLHGHLCAGQILGVRMAMVGCREIDIEEPRGCKKLIVYVEIDRCATDAIQAVTGCSLGKRTLKFLDYGKMAATFINLQTGKAIRIVAKDESRSQIPAYVNGCSNQHEAEKSAYLIMPEEVLFDIQPAKIQIPAEDMPGLRGERSVCTKCGEGINFRREVQINGQIFCIPCARGSYPTQSGKQRLAAPHPKVLLVVGGKKSGKTTLIEKLIPELCGRGYRIGTVKHHHSSSPLDVDRAGKDSWRHRKAGARFVALVSPTEVATFQNTEEATPLEEVIGSLIGVDLVLVEGFRAESKPRIQIRGGLTQNASSYAKDEYLLALVTPENSNGEVPCFRPDEIRPLADLIEERMLIGSSSTLTFTPMRGAVR